MSGGKVIQTGTVSVTHDYHIANAINENTAAALYVISHHTVQYGMITLQQFSAICHDRGIPVIVDAASEYDFKTFLEQGADVVNYSGPKFLGGPTSGIVAGRKDLVRSAYLQNRRIGRLVKVGKESIAGVMAVLEAWEKRDHKAICQTERAVLELWHTKLNGFKGVRSEIVPDPTDNPLDRLEVSISPESGFTAAGLAKALAELDPPIIVRGHEVERGHFYLDPCNLHPGEASIVADSISQLLENDKRPDFAMMMPLRSSTPVLMWPD
ncbi:aminotransferase class V-fold PLP-dependent enzyme [Brucella intermedia]|uniref:aminotransferase class V-fold PLP-dependent enzyme n=1 Tax=Brucella intermedia TaxID=94625 RepID=UPI003B637B30